ncbi:MAG TPA: ATP-binding protein, partial [Gemmataceae bacterium]|nr:ATP-binding protein [Gemmataceae bacterium]
LIFVKDLEGRFVLTNRAYERLTGEACKGMAGKTNHDYFPPAVADAMHAYDRKVLQVRGPIPYEESFPVHGELRHFMTVKFPLFDAAGNPNAVCGIAMDVTERRRAEEASRFLAEASAALAGLVDFQSTLQRVARLAVPFFADWCYIDIAEADGTLRRLALVHRDPAKVELGEDMSRRYPPDSEGRTGTGLVFRSGDARLVSEITDDMLVDLARDDEHLQYLRGLGLKSYIGVPLRRAGQPIGVLTFITGESGRRYGAADLDLAKDLAHRAGVAIENARLYAELREADRLKDEFLAMLAHELRNPLTPIRNSLHIMKQPAADGHMIGRVREMAERQVLHMARLLDDLLDVSRISRGRIELRRQSIDLTAVVQRTVEAVSAFIAEQKHELTVTVPPHPVSVKGDPARLEQILTNLLNNAAKYTDPGGRIWLSVHEEGREVSVRVRDTGIGIAPDMLPRIFDLFVQAERRIDRAQGGVGIGLTLVRKLVELHSGRIEATSAGPGQGSEFSVYLPALPEVPGVQEARNVSDASAPSAGPRRRVLVVDDNVDAADSLTVLLRLQGQEVHAAYDGPTALEVARNCRPDVVLLDVGMPEMDGYEVARRLRQQPGMEHALLVAMTGWGQEEDRRRSREAGFDHHLVKPVEPETLHTLLAEPARVAAR